jgi:hypothetical protein
VDTIHTFFHPHTFSRELAGALHAPNTELHPSLLAELNRAKRQVESMESGLNLSDDEQEYVLLPSDNEN